MTKEMSNNKSLTNRQLTEKNKKLIFYLIMVIPLILQVAVFYVYINVSNILLAFNTYEFIEGVGEVSRFAGLENFKFVLNMLFSAENIGMINMSLLMYFFILLVVTPLTVFFSYYIYKNYMASEFFRIMLFMPQVVSAVVMTLLYSYFVGDIYREVFGATTSLLKAKGYQTVLTVIVYTLWMGFGSNILLCSGAMSGINDSIVEACHLDGCNAIKEFWYITLPSIYTTLTTFIVIDIAGIFVNQMHLFTFYGETASTYMPSVSIGYFMYLQTYKSPGLSSNGSAWLTYPQISALGLIITAVVLPLTLLIRKAMEKFGPSED